MRNEYINDYMLLTESAIALAALRGFRAEEKDGRLHVSKGAETYSTMVTDGLICRSGFDRFMREIKQLEKFNVESIDNN